MKKGIKVSLYSPYLDVMGGGEKHILSILKVFAKQDAEISIFWNKNLSLELKKRFFFDFTDKINWLPLSSKTFQTLSNFDYFFYVTDGSFFFSGAKNNFVFCMVPDSKLYSLSLLNRIKLWNFKFISNSPYTTKWLTKWGINPITIPPYIDDRLFINDGIKKEKTILSVGRFFPHLHSKNQNKIINTFLELIRSPDFEDYKLILAGGVKKEDQKYFDDLKSKTNNPSVVFKPNLPIKELFKLYQQSTYFWHFAGLGIDEEKHPEQVEHFGIAPLEAIASGSIAFCHNSGGPKELLSDGVTGILFNNENELIEKISKLEKDLGLKEKLVRQGKTMVKKEYSYEIFENRVAKII